MTTPYLKTLLFSSICLLLASCAPKHAKGTFGHDLEFLKMHQELITLEANQGKSQVIVLPGLQGRVMTSTSNGMAGNSYGWMHYELLASGKYEDHINPFGGEDRFWIGPEGGQYSIFFKKGSEFTFDNWYTPSELDTEAFDVVSRSNEDVVLQKKMHLVNYHGFEFDIEVNRQVRIIDQKEARDDLGMDFGSGVNYVAYQSHNEIKNVGSQRWSKESGLLSIWILGMFIPAENTTVILPYKDSLALNTSYFGSIPPGRLSISEKHVMYKGDGTYRFKLGLPPQNVMPYVGSYDADKQILTIVSYTFDGDNTYVNSLWEKQENPYAGDVINSYNDGPLENGEQLGPFYELESSSSAKELNPGESIKHTHTTYHFEGSVEELNEISTRLLKIDLNDLNKEEEKMYVPSQANEFTWVYKPAGDYFFGPDTEYLTEGQWYDEWVANDHTFVKAEDGLWHIIGITHPLVESEPLQAGIHDGEYASFHAVSSLNNFTETLEEGHYSDLPKILPPKERPGEVLANHAPYIVKKDGLYQMVYGHSPIRVAVSPDLHSWEVKGNLFQEKEEDRDLDLLFGDARDPNLLYYDGSYYIIYCSTKSVNLRTSTDFVNWSEPKTILKTEKFDPESPSLIYYNDAFYLFVCSWDGIWDQKEIVGAYQHKTYVLLSDDPLNFGTDDEKQVAILNAHAPEIFQDEHGQWYISSVEWPKRGVSVDKLTWVKQ